MPVWECSPHTERGLWVSRRDGSDLREIGHVVEKPADISKTPRFVATPMVQQAMAQWLSRDLNQVEWLPDSKHVLFAVGNDVYTVSVD